MVKKKLMNSVKYRKAFTDCAKPVEGATYMFNRNPRNLEMMKIANRSTGYSLDQPGRCFWHK